MIVVDTSAWIEFFRETGSPVHREVAGRLQRGHDLALTEVVVLEMLAGAPRRRVDELRAQLLAFPVLPLRGLAAFESAAALYRACRAAGETLRTMTDCLIAVSAIEAGAPVLHADDDFETLARHTALQVVRVAA